MGKHMLLFGISLITIFLTITFFANSPAQTAFEMTYGGSGYDEGSAVLQAADGGYVICGRTDSFGAGGTDVYLIKTDAMGNEVWMRTYGGSAQDYGNDVIQTRDGGYLLVGQTSSYGNGNSDIYLIKTDDVGNELWSRAYGTARYEGGNAVIQTVDWGFVIAGWTADSFGPEGNIDIYVVRIDASGDTLWTSAAGYDHTEDRGHAVIEDTNLNTIVVYGYGQNNQSEPWYDVAKAEFSEATGSLLAFVLYGGPYIEFGYDAEYDITNDVVAGSKEEAGLPDVYLTKINEWEHTYGGSNYDGGSALDRTSDGGFIIAGYTRSFGVGQNDVYLVRTNSSGDSLWATTFGGSGWDEGNSVQQTSDGGYVIAGVTDSFGAGQSDVYLIKTDANGPVGIEEDIPAAMDIPKTFSLSQNYPNPFNPSTTIDFTIPDHHRGMIDVEIYIYDMRGRLVKRLVERALPPGSHKVHWDGRRENGQSAGSGIYLYRIRAGSFESHRKMTLIR